MPVQFHSRVTISQQLKGRRFHMPAIPLHIWEIREVIAVKWQNVTVT